MLRESVLVVNLPFPGCLFNPNAIFFFSCTSDRKGINFPLSGAVPLLSAACPVSSMEMLPAFRTIV